MKESNGEKLEQNKSLLVSTKQWVEKNFTKGAAHEDGVTEAGQVKILEKKITTDNANSSKENPSIPSMHARE